MRACVSFALLSLSHSNNSSGWFISNPPLSSVTHPTLNPVTCHAYRRHLPSLTHPHSAAGRAEGRTSRVRDEGAEKKRDTERERHIRTHREAQLKRPCSGIGQRESVFRDSDGVDRTYVYMSPNRLLPSIRPSARDLKPV